MLLTVFRVVRHLLLMRPLTAQCTLDCENAPSSVSPLKAMFTLHPLGTTSNLLHGTVANDPHARGLRKPILVVSAATPEPGIQAGPEGFPEGLLRGVRAFLRAAAGHDRLHQLDEYVTQLVLPPAVLRLQQREPLSATRK